MPELRDVEVAGLPPADPATRAVFRELLDIPGIAVYLHGSRADGTATAFSDYDDLVIIDRSVVAAAGRERNLARSLARVERRFQRLDPLQHHGHFLVDRARLEAYDASFLPPAALRRAVVVRGADRIRFRVDPGATRAGLEVGILAACRAVRALDAEYRTGRITAYRLKKLAGIFALMPAYLFQHGGSDLDKAAAIGRAAEVIPDTALETLRWATACRDGWDAVVTWRVAAFHRVLTRLVRHPSLYRRIADRVGPRAPLASAGLDGLRAPAVQAWLAHCEARVRAS